MRTSGEQGFSMMEVIIAVAVSSLLSAALLQMISAITRSYSTQQSTSDVIWQGRAAMNLMVNDLRMAGFPAKSTYTATAGVTPANSNLVASPFLTTTATDVVFEADLDGDGVVERVEYRLSNNTLQRSDVPKNSNGTIPAVDYQTVASNVANGSTPIFTYTTDVNSTQAAPGNTNSAQIYLILRTANPDPANQQTKTFQFRGLAYRLNPDH